MPLTYTLHMCMALDPALGYEIKKTRPALVIRNDVSNPYSDRSGHHLESESAALPQRSDHQPTAASGLQVVSTVRLDQLRTIDRQRLIKRLGKADPGTMRAFDLAIRASLHLV